MGFKDLCKFNKALLKKQVGRLIHNEHSLFYKVFKAKYFPHGSIFDATVSFGSFAWQSILISRHLIEVDARWRVGDGQHVRIFTDRWLPNEGGFLLYSPGELHSEATVSKLINRTLGWWNVQLIDHCFHPPNATRIKALPLCSTPQLDVLIWPLEKSGKYSIKSRFRLLCEGQDSAETLLQASNEERGFWKKLWKIQVPEKIKHFLWWACTNSLTTKENLVKRKILPDAICSRYSGAHEDTLHSLWSCDGLKEVWMKDFGWIFRFRVLFSSFKELVKLVFTRSNLIPLFAITTWSIWFHRNKI